MPGDDTSRNLRLLEQYLAIRPGMAVAAILDPAGRFYRRGQRPASIPMGVPQDCVGNAIKVMENHGLPYVEGFALTSDDKIIRHAWNIDTAGLAIDVTIPDEEPVAYFGIVMDDPRSKLGRGQFPLQNWGLDVVQGTDNPPPPLVSGSFRAS